MSFAKISAVALFALSASAQLYPIATNASYIAGTSVAPVGYPTPTQAAPTYEVNGKYWAYDGCAASSSNFAGFTQVAVTLNDVEQCIAACSVSNSEYAGLLGSSCYCSDDTDDATTIVPDGECSFTCPGNTDEYCGGSSVGTSYYGKRQATVPTGALLSLYQVLQVIPAGVYTTVCTTEYVSVCPTGLTTVPYSTTITGTHCGCTDVTPSATIPMTTTVGSCGCGEGGAQMTYTVTVPTAVCPTATQTVAVVSATPAISTVTVSACPGGGASAAPAAPVAATPAPVNGGSGNNGAASYGAGNGPTYAASAPQATYTGAASKKAAGGLVAVIAVGAFAIL